MQNDNSGVNRRTALLAAIGLAAAPAAGIAGARAGGTRSNLEDPVVETTSGKVRGFTNAGVAVFRGIPYGASTTGANRFMPPVKPEPWAGIRNCLSYGHSCPEGGIGVFENDSGARNTDEDEYVLYRTHGWKRGEDCLRLNVWTASGASDRSKRPVMVYMHGGGFTGGSGNDLLSYDGENLARQHDVVVVTHNHRLNLFGFLNLAEIGGERYASSGNASMLDIVAVLEWVRDNIAGFGGDPGNVLIYGQSGGGGKVSALLAMPAAKGLFHRAVVQSGSTLRMGSMENSERLAALVLQELGLSKMQLDKIHALPTSALQAVQPVVLKKWRAAGANTGSGMGNWQPVVDGKVLPGHPFDPGAPDVSAHVPLLVGTCLNEFVNGCDNPERDTLTDEDLSKRLTARYGNRALDIKAAYQKQYPKASPFGLWAAISAAGVRQNAITQAERKARQGGAPVYMYVYAWRTPVLGGKIGTFHSSEITFAFDNAALCPQYSGGGLEALQLSKAMGAAWAGFARGGKPDNSGLPPWPAYDLQKRATMFFNSPSAVVSHPEEEGLQLIGQGS